MYNVSMLAIKILTEGMQNTEGKTGVQLQRYRQIEGTNGATNNTQKTTNILVLLGM
jgi:hypothetical protein